MAAVNITNQQLQELIAAVTARAAGGAGGAAGTISAAALVGPMGACTLGNDKLKRPKKWRDWLREAENKMRFAGITVDDVGLLYQGPIPDYGRKRETCQDGWRRVTRGRRREEQRRGRT